MPDELLSMTPAGLYCEPGDFYVDPWRPVRHAVITHAHADHVRHGSQRYLAAESGKEIMRIRMGTDADLQFQPFGRPLTMGSVQVTFFPAGHILGSAQVRIEMDGRSIVVSGDYKRQVDPTCQAFEPVRCHTFVTESTFGLPIYRWPDADSEFLSINRWWQNNQAERKASLLLGYSLGKAQRLIAGIDADIGPIYTHGAVEKICAGYRAAGVALPVTTYVGNAEPGTDWSRALIVAPPSAAGTTWTRKFGNLSSAMASGWMQIRGTRRRRSVDRGFVLSDHVDWRDLLRTIDETEAEQVWVTHGYNDIVVRYLRESGTEARVVETEFEGELLDEPSQESSDE